MASTRSAAATIKALDHIVLTVKSIPATRDWYVQHLGMRAESFVSQTTAPNVTRHSLIFGQQKINLHESGNEFEPKAQNVKPGSADLCFLTDDRVGDVWKRLVDAGVSMVDVGTADGTVQRTGARGKLLSFYCRDPDGNLIE